MSPLDCLPIAVVIALDSSLQRLRNMLDSVSYSSSSLRLGHRDNSPRLSDIDAVCTALQQHSPAAPLTLAPVRGHNPSFAERPGLAYPKETHVRNEAGPKRALERP